MLLEMSKSKVSMLYWLQKEGISTRKLAHKSKLEVEKAFWSVIEKKYSVEGGCKCC